MFSNFTPHRCNGLWRSGIISTQLHVKKSEQLVFAIPPKKTESFRWKKPFLTYSSSTGSTDKKKQFNECSTLLHRCGKLWHKFLFVISKTPGMNKLIPQNLKTIKNSMSSIEAILPFTEKPSNAHFAHKQKVGNEEIEAYDLFSLFTANIIKEEVVFTR